MPCASRSSQRVPDSPLDGKPPDPSGGGSAETGDQQDTKEVYPTDSRERARDEKNRRKAQGIAERVVKKKVFKVEDHYDDCGDDLSSLGPDLLFVGISHPYHLDTDEEFVDRDYDLALRQHTSYPTYPIDPSTIAQPVPGVPKRGRDPRAVPSWRSTCPSCRENRARDDWDHTREIGQCAFPHDQPVLPQCKGCQLRHHRTENTHSFREGHCRWSKASQFRLGRQLSGSGKHNPREAQVRRDFEPTAGLPGTFEGRELGQGGEEAIAREDAVAAASRRGARSAAPVEGETPDVGGASGSGHAPGEGRLPEPVVAPGEGPLPEPVVRQGRDADQNPRVRRVMQDDAVGPERPDDWTNFDIGRVVRLLRSNRLGAIRLTLRKLHVRWWRASHLTMRRMLERCGVSEAVLKLLPEIAQTCKVCREWARPGPSNASNLEVADTFNKQVEADLLFIHKFIIFHMIDRCTRWHAGQLVDGKTEEDCMGAVAGLGFPYVARRRS